MQQRQGSLNLFQKKLKSEREGIDNAKFYSDGQADVIDKQIKFSDSDINLNRICHYMENRLQAIDAKISESKFDLDKFLKMFVTENPNETSNLYIEIRKKLIELSDENADLYKQLMEDDNKEESKVLFFKLKEKLILRLF